MFSLKKVEAAGCRHPLPHRVTEETQPLLTLPHKRQWAEVTAGKILVRHMGKISFCNSGAGLGQAPESW